MILPVCETTEVFKKHLEQELKYMHNLDEKKRLLSQFLHFTLELEQTKQHQMTKSSAKKFGRKVEDSCKKREYTRLDGEDKLHISEIQNRNSQIFFSAISIMKM